MSAGGGGSRAKPADTNLPGAPGRFLSWLPREPTLEGTLKRGGTAVSSGTLVRGGTKASAGGKWSHRSRTRTANPGSENKKPHT